MFYTCLYIQSFWFGRHKLVEQWCFYSVASYVYSIRHSFLKARNRRKIVLTSRYITYYHEDKILAKIDISEIDVVKRTFLDFYHKSQRDNPWGYVLSIVTFPITILMHASLIICKIFFHTFKSKFNFYKFYDSIIVFDKNENFINILFTSKDKYEEVKRYFLLKSHINIDNSDKFYILTYIYEKINYEELKKE